MIINKKIENLYILALFTIYNVIVFDIGSISFKNIILALLGIIASFAIMLKGSFIEDIGKSRVKIAAVAITLLWIIKEMVTGEYRIEAPVFVLSIILMYCVIDSGNILENILIKILGVSNFVVYVFLLIKLFVVEDYFTMDTVGVSFIIMSVTLNILSYVMYDDMKPWYIVNTAVGSFLLFAEKNILAILIVGIVFLLVPLVYIPTKKLVRKNSQLMFMYWFILANMSLLTGYIEIFDTIPKYDLEISVYMELLLAIAGVVFFHMWDKYAGEDVEEYVVVYRFREYYQMMLIIAVVGMAVLLMAVIRGDSQILPDEILPIIERIKENIAYENNLFQMAGSSYGTVGIIGAVAFTVYGCNRIYSRIEYTKTLKAMRIFLIIYFIQMMGVTQTLANTPICIAIAILYIKAYDGWRPRKNYRHNRKGGTTNEANNTDTVLQRIGDTGDSTQRPSEDVKGD